MSSCFFSRVDSECSGASQFLLDLSLLGVHLTLFFLETGLSARQDQRIVLLGLLLDLAEKLALTLAGTSKLLGKCLLHFLLLRLFSRVLSFSDQKDSLVEIACTLLTFSDALDALRLRGLLPLTETLDDALALGSLKTVLALLGYAHPISVVAQLLELRGHDLTAALVSAIEFVFDHLEGDLVALELLALLF